MRCNIGWQLMAAKLITLVNWPSQASVKQQHLQTKNLMSQILIDPLVLIDPQVFMHLHT